jgi:hypothetical protein
MFWYDVAEKTGDEEWAFWETESPPQHAKTGRAGGLLDRIPCIGVVM